ncbi:MAG: DnaJ domain-containing protein [Lentisphaeria bacterium]|nr:DnaJ domain-containing protein [Lentisphaeria bacterium]
MLDHYQRLGVPRGCSFQALKQAYRTRAKACHPDRFRNSPVKTAEFQELVRAFNVLSDPALRAAYDRTLAAGETVTFSVGKTPDLDTEADDILEELIVGNNVPPESSLATLLSDLAKTEVFLTFREGKNHFIARKWQNAENCFRRAMEFSPQNILYRIYLARSLAEQGGFWAAAWQYRFALKLGAARVPRLYMPRIRREYSAMFRKHHPVLAKFFSGFLPPDNPFVEDEAEKMERALSRTLARELKKGKNIGTDRQLR